MTLTADQKESLLEAIKMILDDDILTLEDSAKIMEICREACRQTRMDIKEQLLMISIEKSTHSGSGEAEQ